ncbi:hypothetical protein TWF718_002427 [Orbilia javanica]|uniref:Uncharacterized protein n=1 Tax=Orbilia javanica TaxID=47235 RepID=A0AAN8RBE9_9PEZI
MVCEYTLFNFPGCGCIALVPLQFCPEHLDPDPNNPCYEEGKENIKNPARITMLFGGIANPIPHKTYEIMLKLYKNPLLAKDPRLSNKHGQLFYEAIAKTMVQMDRSTVTFPDGGKVKAGFHTKLTRYHVIYPSCKNMQIQRPLDENYWPFAEVNCFEHSDSFIEDRARNKWTIAPRPRLEHFDEPFIDRFNAAVAVRFLKLLNEGDAIHKLIYDRPGCYPDGFHPRDKTYNPEPDENKENEANQSDSSDYSEVTASSVAEGGLGKEGEESRENQEKVESEYEDSAEESEEETNPNNGYIPSNKEGKNGPEKEEEMSFNKNKKLLKAKKKQEALAKSKPTIPDAKADVPSNTNKPNKRPVLKKKTKKEEDAAWNGSDEDDDEEELEGEGGGKKKKAKRPANKKVTFKEASMKETNAPEQLRAKNQNLADNTSTKNDKTGDEASGAVISQRKNKTENDPKHHTSPDGESDEEEELEVLTEGSDKMETSERGSNFDSDEDDETFGDEDSDFAEPVTGKKAKKPVSEGGKEKPKSEYSDSASRSKGEEGTHSNSEDKLSEVFTEVDPKPPKRRAKRGEESPELSGLRRAKKSQLDEVGSGLRLYRAQGRPQEQGLLTTEEMEQLEFPATSQTLDDIFDGWAQAKLQD